MEPADPAERKRRGAWYTPGPLVDFLVEQAVRPVLLEAVRVGRTEPIRVLDPSCGDGRVLAAADNLLRAPLAHRIGADSVDDARPRLNLMGIESDAEAAESARRAVPDARVVLGDGRSIDPGHTFDAVVGNPPYLGQLARATSRGGRSPLGGGPYADVAAEFLLRAVSLARPDGGRVALVLPQSILASRDTAPVRVAVAAQAAVVGLWWAGEPIFDAQVSVCIVVLRRGAPQRNVRRWRGRDLRSLPAAPASALAGRTWSPLIADVAGVPALAMCTGTARLRDLASATAGFRHQYYGLVEHVRDDGPGAPLVTAGLIDAGRCRWGTAPARFAKRRFRAPRVDVDSLDATDPVLGRWVHERLVPKVLVATQTRVIEAVADPDGAWVPSVPVVAVHPHRVEDLWSVAAVLTAPPVAAWAATHHLGTGLGPTALKLSATQVLDLPLPRRSWGGAADLLRAGDVHGCAEAMCDAYEVTEPHREPLMAWWRSATAGSCPSNPGG